MFSVQVDLSKLDAALVRAEKYMKERAQKEAAKEIIEWIPLRTAQGQDIKNRSFKPYKPVYSARRAKHGLGTAPVDLKWSGEMLRLEYNESTKRITPPSDAMGRAKGHQFGYAPKKLPARPWLGVTKDEAMLIGKQLGTNLKSYILK